jgi:iron complex outermembrane receptor protein
VNIDALNFTGVSSGVRFAISTAQSLDFKYSWLQGNEDSIPIGETKYTFYYPVHSGVVAWQASLPSHFMLRTHVGVIDRRAEGVYAVVDVDAAYTRGSVHPFLRLSNLANMSYEEVQSVVMPGRTIIGGVELVLRKK